MRWQLKSILACYSQATLSCSFIEELEKIPKSKVFVRLSLTLITKEIFLAQISVLHVASYFPGKPFLYSSSYCNGSIQKVYWISFSTVWGKFMLVYALILLPYIPGWFNAPWLLLKFYWFEDTLVWRVSLVLLSFMSYTFDGTVSPSENW